MVGNRLLGVSAIMDPDPNGPVTGFDMGGLVRRLLLFEKYIVVSIRLQEFRFLAQHLGYARTRDLLNSGLLEIRNECVQMADVGSSNLFGAPKLAPMHYQFNWIEFHDRKGTTSTHLECLRDVPTISQKESSRLRGQIAGLINPLPHQAKRIFGESFFEEVGNTPLVKQAVRQAMSRLNLPAPPQFEIAVIRESSDIVRVETDLTRTYAIPLADAHKACQHGLLAIATLMQQIGEMNVYRALSGFREEDSPLFRTKMSQVFAEQLSSTERERDFQHVVELTGLPDYNYNERLDVDKLLKVREAPETRVFRDWLQQGGASSDAEIKDLTAGYRNVLGHVLNDKFGKSLRLLLSTAAGMIPKYGLVAGPMASVADLILADLFPRPGVTAFIHELYPSLFSEK